MKLLPKSLGLTDDLKGIFSCLMGFLSRSTTDESGRRKVDEIAGMVESKN